MKVNLPQPPRLFFCFPYRGVGGVSLLFLRVGTYLAEQLGIDVTLIDYADGYMAKNLRSDRVKLLTYTDDGAAPVPADAVLVLQAMNPWSIFPGLAVSPGARLVFWHCLPFNLVPALPGLRDISYRTPALLQASLFTVLAERRRLNSRLVEAMHAGQALFFMDEENVEGVRRFLGAKVDEPIYLPIPVALPKHSAARPTHAADAPLRLVWVGRIADFKHHILSRTLQDLDDYSRTTGRAVAVTIVGSGPFLAEVQEKASQLQTFVPTYVDSIAPDQLDGVLTAEADIVMAMGTAALDGARLGIPTILLDPSYGAVSAAYRYRWLFEERGYTLGRILFNPDSYPKGKPLAGLLDAFDREWPRLSRLSADYVAANHAMTVVAAKLVSLVERATYKWGDLSDSGANRRDWIYRAFVFGRQLVGRRR